MKRISSLLIITLSIILSITSSCEKYTFDESVPVNPVMTPIKSVTAMDGEKEVEAVISDKDRTIQLDLLHLRSLSNVDVKLHISKRAKLISPNDTILNLDLTKPYQITVNNLFKDIVYTLNASIPEFVEIDKAKFSEYKLDNDTPPLENTKIEYLWDGQAMSKPEKYGEIGYRNYLTNESFTVDLGDYYNLKGFKANLYWAYKNVCPKKYELWGYSEQGTPPKDGDWSKWTKLAEIDNSKSTLDDFGDGDSVEFTKTESPLVRYVRVRGIENYRNPSTTIFSLCEITFWAWNM